MEINIPVGLIAALFSLTTFYYFNRKNKMKKQIRRDGLNEIRKELHASFFKL